MSLDAVVTLLAGLGLVGDVGSVLVGIDLVRLGSFDRLRHARNNVKSNVNKFVMEHEPRLVPILIFCKIPICIKTRSKPV